MRGNHSTPSPVDWNRLARWYRLQLHLERPALRAGADLLAAGPADRVIDVGTGTGAFLGELASRPDRPASAVGIDTSDEMLRRAPQLPAGWSVRHGAVIALPLADGSVDAAGCTYLLHLLGKGELTAALAELRRVLRPGGRLVTVTPAVPRSALGPVYAALAARLAAATPELFAGLRPFDPSPALAAGGFRLERGVYVARGYPSLCVLARRA